MAENTDVISVLEDARSRLELASRSAEEAEAEAQAILDYLQHESAEWSITMAAEVDRVSHAGQALSERWTHIQDRLRALGEELTAEYAALHQQLDADMASIVATWNGCSHRLPEITRHLQDHEQTCQTSQQTHQQLTEAGNQAYSDAILVAHDSVISPSETLGDRLGSSRVETEVSVSEALAGKQQRLRESTAASLDHQQSASERISHLQSGFTEQMTAEVDKFNHQLTADVETLKSAATAASDSMKNMADSIGTAVESLSQGADDVVDVMNLTNVGMNTVVGIVHAGLQICDEVIDEFNG